MAHSITYSDGRTVPSVIAIWDDLHHERPGYYRAFWVAETDVTGNGSPVVGYCSPGGAFRTIRAAVADAKRRYPGTPVYRNGREATGTRRQTCVSCRGICGRLRRTD